MKKSIINLTKALFLYFTHKKSIPPESINHLADLTTDNSLKKALNSFKDEAIFEKATGIRCSPNKRQALINEYLEGFINFNNLKSISNYVKPVINNHYKLSLQH